MKSLWAGVLVLLLAAGIAAWLWTRSQLLKVDCLLTLTAGQGAARSRPIDPRDPEGLWKELVRREILDLLPATPDAAASLQLVMDLTIEKRQWRLGIPPWTQAGRTKARAVKTLTFSPGRDPEWLLIQGSQKFPLPSREAGAERVVEFFALHLNNYRRELGLARD